MEVEHTDVRLRSDGRKLVDITLRRKSENANNFAAPVLAATEGPLVVPRFDDEDSDSSSGSEGDDEPSAAPQTSRIPRANPAASAIGSKIVRGRGDMANNNMDDDEDDDQAEPNTQQAPIFTGEMQWNGVQDIQALTNSNAALSAQVADLKHQLKVMDIQLEALLPVPGLHPEAVQDLLLDKNSMDHDVRNAKIVHQAKTIRHLKRAAQREKQLAADAVKLSKQAEMAKQQLDKEVDTLKLKLQRMEARAAASSSHPTNESAASDSAMSPPPLSTTSASDSKKLCDDLKAKNTALQQELKRTQRALIREVGDDVPLDELIAGDGTNGRRGRAQQIIMLKAKIKKLEGETIKATATSPTSKSGKQSGLDVDQRAQQELAGQSAHRQKQIDQLAEERDALHDSLQQVSRKLEALRSRSQILEKEKQDTKAKLQVLVDKSKNDDALVDVLQKQLEIWKGKFQEAKRMRSAENTNTRGGIASNSEDRAEIERLRQLVSDLQRQAPMSSRTETPPAHRSNNPMPAPTDVAQFRAVTVETERLRELVKSLQAQLDDKDKQLRGSTGNQASQPSALPSFLPSIGPSRIPRKGGRSTPVLAGDDVRNALTTPSSNSQSRIDDLEHEMETMRKTFRDSLREKDERIAELQQALAVRQEDPSSCQDDSSALAQEVEDLQEENQFLRQEFDKLKARYEAITRAQPRN